MTHIPPTLRQPSKPSNRLLQIVGLQTPAGRLWFFALASFLIFLAPYGWLAHLSLWQQLGISAPSIGLTRAYHLLLHGHPQAAWWRNKLIYLVLSIGLPLLLRDALQLRQRHL